jgi:soluble lytic murein transglycosylase-like protein
VGIRWLAALLVAWTTASICAESVVYAYADADGHLFLSNVPADRRYSILVGMPERDAVDRSGGTGLRKAGRKAKFDATIDRVAQLQGLESALLHAIIATESAYDPAARSQKGAAGLMQLMPATARRYGVSDSFDVEQNVNGGARYLKDLLQKFDYDLPLALAAYNAGEGAVLRNQNRIPGFRETMEYVPKVLANYQRLTGVPYMRSVPTPNEGPRDAKSSSRR